MRTNLPVTQNEVELRDETLIVSKTDLKGRITYINRDFLAVSGFSEQELIGEPHNIVRHPDMPPEAFDDFWNTLKAERPWTGLVKNRCKNGDFYWVLANATPIWEGGQVTGYMSVRRKAPREKIQEAERIYKLFRDKQQGSLRIRYGEVVKGGESAFANLSLTSRMYLILGFLCLTLIAQAVIGLFVASGANETAQFIYERRLEPVRIVGRIGKLMADNRAQILLGLQHDPAGAYAKLHDHPLDRHSDAVKGNIDEIGKLWESYQPLIHSDGHRAMAAAYAESRKKFVQEGLLPARKAMLEGDFNDANLILLEKINPLYTEAAGKADELFKYHTEKSHAEFVSSQARFEQTRLGMIVGVAIVVLLGFFGAGWLIRSVKRPVDEVANTLGNVAQGDYSNHIDVTKNDELGKMLQRLQAMQTRMGFEVAETKRTADEMTRIKIALDNVSTGVMIADPDRNIIYANSSVVRILKGAEEAIRTQLPNFSADNMVGVNIDTFHKNPAHQANLLATFTQPYGANLEIGGRFLTVTANPVISDKGERLGAVAEWQDRTAEVVIEREVEEIVQAASYGVLDMRLEMEGKEGFFAKLSEGINTLLSNTQRALNATSEVLNLVARGDLTRTVEDDYAGIFGQLKDDTNTTVERLREVVGRIKEASDAINVASKEIAAGNQDLSARTEQAASNLEETSSSMEELNATVKQNAENAKQANELAHSSNEIAVRGGEMVKRVVSTMGDIQSSSRKIADIIGVIDSIAFQTNILALNAAVEAARAGEQGRGFAVVATEVRNLAQRSATAAKEIKGLIAESVDKVEGGARLVQQAGSTMDEVVQSFQRVAALVTDISSASREQSAGIEQVTQAVSQMDEVTQQNAALVEEAAAAAESLEEQAQGLVQAVGSFKLAEGVAEVRATPRLANPAKPQAHAQAHAAPKQKKIPPPHLADDNDEWEEF
ncbi:MAG: methyl-accepting chemotaxis protein [Rhodocyclaceae bacterium]|nr:methyl-accepting chemotaxis protein [Rhodocyclaceae bacterium]